MPIPRSRTQINMRTRVGAMTANSIEIAPRTPSAPPVKRESPRRIGVNRFANSARTSMPSFHQACGRRAHRLRSVPPAVDRQIGVSRKGDGIGDELRTAVAGARTPAKGQIRLRQVNRAPERLRSAAAEFERGADAHVAGVRAPAT